jgi:hypothetical protein
MDDKELAHWEEVARENAEMMRRHPPQTEERRRMLRRQWMSRSRRRQALETAAVGICILALMVAGLIAFGLIR